MGQKVDEALVLPTVPCHCPWRLKIKPWQQGYPKAGAITVFKFTNWAWEGKECLCRCALKLISKTDAWRA